MKLLEGIKNKVSENNISKNTLTKGCVIALSIVLGTSIAEASGNNINQQKVEYKVVPCTNGSCFTTVEKPVKFIGQKGKSMVRLTVLTNEGKKVWENECLPRKGVYSKQEWAIENSCTNLSNTIKLNSLLGKIDKDTFNCIQDSVNSEIDLWTFFGPKTTKVSSNKGSNIITDRIHWTRITIDVVKGIMK